MDVNVGSRSTLVSIWPLVEQVSEAKIAQPSDFAPSHQQVPPKGGVAGQASGVGSDAVVAVRGGCPCHSHRSGAPSSLFCARFRRRTLTRLLKSCEQRRTGFCASSSSDRGGLLGDQVSINALETPAHLTA